MLKEFATSELIEIANLIAKEADFVSLLRQELIKQKEIILDNFKDYIDNGNKPYDEEILELCNIEEALKNLDKKKDEVDIMLSIGGTC